MTFTREVSVSSLVVLRNLEHGVRKPTMKIKMMKTSIKIWKNAVMVLLTSTMEKDMQ